MSFFYKQNLEHEWIIFFVFDQNNQINCLLYFRACFTFEFSHSAVMIIYQYSASQCMNFRRYGLVWKSVATLFSLHCKNHHVLEIQTQQCLESWTGLSRKSYFIFVLQVFPQKRQLDVKIAVWFPWFYQIFRKTLIIVIVLTNKVSNVKMLKWNNSLGDLLIIIHWQISVNHC